MALILKGMFAYELQGMLWSAPAPYDVSKFQADQTLNFSEAWPAVPNLPPSALYSIPMVTGFTPPQGTPAPTTLGDLPIFGFYPITELGYMLFGGSGDVTGALRVNYAGSASGMNEIPFVGKYVMSTETVTMPPNSNYQTPLNGLSPAGLISNQVGVPAKGISNFDYAFVFVSNDEMLITASARHPRAGVLSGTMKRIVGVAPGFHAPSDGQDQEVVTKSPW
jgi:hypothetical protein